MTRPRRNLRWPLDIAAGGAGYFIAGFTLFLLALLWGAVTYQLDHEKTAILDDQLTDASNLARAYAEHVLGTLRLLDQTLLRIKTEYENTPAAPNLVESLKDASNLSARIVPIAITDERGTILASTLRLSPQDKLPEMFSPKAIFAGDRDYFRAQLTDDSGRLYIGEPMESRINGKQVIALSRRLNHPDGGFAGIVFASFDPEYLSGFFSDLPIRKDSSFALVGRDMIVRDMIRGTGRDTGSIGKSLADSQLVAAVAHAAIGNYVAVDPLDGNRRIYAFRTLPYYPLVVVASFAQTEVLADFQARKRWLNGLAAALTLVFLGVAYFQLRQMTERKRNEIMLNRSRENLARAQHMAAIGNFERDFITDTAEWSDEMYRILGLDKAAIRPGSDILIQLIHPEDRAKFLEERAGQLNGQPTKPIEYRIIRPDGAERIVRREIAVVFGAGGRPIRHYGTLQDITELRIAEQRERELERHLLHSQKLEALGTLAGGIAHDLNNSLTPIMALSKVTARRLEPGPIRDNLDTIYVASEQARDLVKRILAFSRREKIDKKPADIGTIVGDALKLLRATIPTSIQLAIEIGDVPTILADASQIHQVVTNLVSNAAQAIGNELGAITVTLGRVAGSAGPETVRLSVADTGVGMDETTRRRIFEPFFTTKAVGHGTGLGLSIIEGIVADHGGWIEVESEVGKGTRFDIYIPLPKAEESAAA